MIVRSFGSTGIEVPAIGQGTWNVPPLRAAGADEAMRALHIGIERGMVHIDTAEMYGDGNAELMIADAISGLPREDLFLVSKVLPSNASYDGTIAACERSLKRLRVDYLDAYLLHWRGTHPLHETMHALEKLVDNGKVRMLGVCNFDINDLTEALAALHHHKIACNQVLYHLNERSVESHELPFCRENGIAVVGYTPFGRGDWAHGSGVGVLREIAEQREVSMRAIILAFLTRHDDVFTIPKASKVEHVEENAAGGAIRLSNEEIARIDFVYPARPRRGGLPTL